MTPPTRTGSAPPPGADAASTPDPDELDFLLDILAAAVVCLKDPDPATRVAGCALAGGLAWPLICVAEDGYDVSPLWDAAAKLEGLHHRDPSGPVRDAAAAALRAIDVARAEVEP